MVRVTLLGVGIKIYGIFRKNVSMVFLALRLSERQIIQVIFFFAVRLVMFVYMREINTFSYRVAFLRYVRGMDTTHSEFMKY